MSRIGEINTLATLHANQILMIGYLKQILTKVNQMAIDLTKLTADEAALAAGVANAVALLQKLVAALAAIPPSSDPVTQAALDAISTKLEGDTATLVAAVTADTPPGP